MNPRHDLKALRAELTAQIAAILKVAPGQVDAAASFLHQGADSIMLVEAADFIARRFGVTLKLTQFFEGLNSIDALAQHLHEAAQGPALAAAPQPEPEPIAAVCASSASPAAALSPGTTAAEEELLDLLRAQISLLRQTLAQQHELLARR